MVSSPVPNIDLFYPTLCGHMVAALAEVLSNSEEEQIELTFKFGDEGRKLIRESNDEHELFKKFVEFCHGKLNNA